MLIELTRVVGGYQLRDNPQRRMRFSVAPERIVAVNRYAWDGDPDPECCMVIVELLPASEDDGHMVLGRYEDICQLVNEARGS